MNEIKVFEAGVKVHHIWARYTADIHHDKRKDHLWSAKSSELATHTLELAILGEDKRKYLFNVPFKEGEPVASSLIVDHSSMTFGMVRLGSDVWTMVPTIQALGYLTFVTLCDVPDPPPWRTEPVKQPVEPDAKCTCNADRSGIENCPRCWKSR